MYVVSLFSLPSTPLRPRHHVPRGTAMKACGTSRGTPIGAALAMAVPGAASRSPHLPGVASTTSRRGATSPISLPGVRGSPRSACSGHRTSEAPSRPTSSRHHSTSPLPHTTLAVSRRDLCRMTSHHATTLIDHRTPHIASTTLKGTSQEVNKTKCRD